LLIGNENRRITTIDNLEWRTLEYRVVGVVAKFSSREPLNPRPRPIPCETVEVHCDHLIDHLGLSIGLWVEG
jgi:hypothetical protein